MPALSYHDDTRFSSYQACDVDPNGSAELASWIVITYCSDSVACDSGLFGRLRGCLRDNEASWHVAVVSISGYVI
jgi:hypothetical protein